MNLGSRPRSPTSWRAKPETTRVAHSQVSFNFTRPSAVYYKHGFADLKDRVDFLLTTHVRRCSQLFSTLHQMTSPDSSHRRAANTKRPILHIEVKLVDNITDNLLVRTDDIRSSVRKWISDNFLRVKIGQHLNTSGLLPTISAHRRIAQLLICCS